MDRPQATKSPGQARLPAIPPRPGGNPKAIPPVPPREPNVRVLLEHPKQTLQPPLKIKVPEKIIKRPEEKEICLKFDPPKDELDRYQTNIGSLLMSRPLPFCVRMKADYHYCGCTMMLTKGMLLNLHFIHRPYRVYATDPGDAEHYLPIRSRQLYHVLPIDPVHDDKLYDTTLELIEARPLPRRVRIEEAHFSDHPGEAQECGDIIEIERIEKRPVPFDSDSDPQLCVIGTCNNVPIAFSESMDCAAYSTMPSVDFMSLSEIVKKFPLPLRVKKADNPDSVMMLHRWDEEYHVITTSANLNQVLSIPASWDGQVEILENATLEHLLQSVLPPLYPLVNTTWGLREPGRVELPPNMQQVAQPLMEILEGWSRTPEGNEFVFEASKTNVDMLKIRIEELMELNARLNNELKIYRVDAPAPPPREDVPTKRPSVPPRLPSVSSPKSTNPRRQGKDSGDYEEPFPKCEVKAPKAHVKAPKAQEELKALLEAREAENIRLQDKIEGLEGVIQVLDGRNASNVDEIQNLRIRLDETQAYTTINDQGAGHSNPKSGLTMYSDMIALKATRNLNSYDEEAVCNMLRDMKLEMYVSNFKENSVNGELLETLDEEDLYGELGMGRLHAKKLMIEVRKRMK